jgi:hypothetical protein
VPSHGSLTDQQRATLEEIVAFDEGDEYIRPGLVPFAGNGYGDQ